MPAFPHGASFTFTNFLLTAKIVLILPIKIPPGMDDWGDFCEVITPLEAVADAKLDTTIARVRDAEIGSEDT